MSYEFPEQFTKQGNPALNNLALYNHIKELSFKTPIHGQNRKRAGSKSALKSVCFVLATYRNNTTGQCNPDMRSIGQGASCSTDTARRSIDELIERGIICKMNFGAVGSRSRNHYYFYWDIDRLVEMFDHESHEMSKTLEQDHVEKMLITYKRYLN